MVGFEFLWVLGFGFLGLWNLSKWVVGFGNQPLLHPVTSCYILFVSSFSSLIFSLSPSVTVSRYIALTVHSRSHSICGKMETLVIISR